MKMVSSKLTRICIGLIVVGLIVPGATLAEIELKDLAGLWLFDEGSGKVVKDSSGNHHVSTGEQIFGLTFIDQPFSFEFHACILVQKSSLCFFRTIIQATV